MACGCGADAALAVHQYVSALGDLIESECDSSVRLLKLARYYEGAELLVKAMSKSISQLLVPMFMVSIMVMCTLGPHCYHQEHVQ